MKIRWVNDVQYLPKSLPRWFLFCCKYPITFLFLAVINFFFGCFLYHWYHVGIHFDVLPTELNSLKNFLEYKIFFIFLSVLFILEVGFLWLFFLLAFSKPVRTITREEALEMSKKFDSKLQPKPSFFPKNDFPKIRWINREVLPLPGSPRWIVFVCKYPFLYLLPNLILVPYAYLWHRWILEWESGEKESLYLGKLKLLYDLFGSFGVVGFYLIIGFGFLWLFWYYAIRKPT
ncbi:hypothetical protein JWG45_05300 [Leptospira sp. 201903070]|uniref:Uncharacterized protein n=1 Tax=Leptospira ainlahdjerensis TaxID=2810033 RepID=A0ABS2U865_9LEPT|nr:hypothetical protein [Leptospira ainlahdjerensis]MBM9576566.1 hypothetical protein [Leptospira ainlahdjerensis]